MMINQIKTKDFLRTAPQCWKTPWNYQRDKWSAPTKDRALVTVGRKRDWQKDQCRSDLAGGIFRIRPILHLINLGSCLHLGWVISKISNELKRWRVKMEKMCPLIPIGIRNRFQMMMSNQLNVIFKNPLYFKVWIEDHRNVWILPSKALN